MGQQQERRYGGNDAKLSNVFVFFSTAFLFRVLSASKVPLRSRTGRLACSFLSKPSESRRNNADDIGRTYLLLDSLLFVIDNEFSVLLSLSDQYARMPQDVRGAPIEFVRAG